MKCKECNSNMEIKVLAGSNDIVMCSFKCLRCLNMGIQFIPTNSFSEKERIAIKEELSKLKKTEV